MEVEAHLLPPMQQLEQTALETIMRMRTSPLHTEMASSESNNTAQSPLDRLSSILESKYSIQLDRLEKRQPHVVPPWWTPPFTRIAESPEVAVREHDTTEPATLRIYTDGSGIDGHVGAAAITTKLQPRGIPTQRSEYMGTSNTSTVYAAELRGIELAFRIALEIHA